MSSNKKENSSKPKTKRVRKQRPFPRNVLQEALKIAQTIQEQNNGQPMKRIYVADHLQTKPESSNFRYLVSSSYRYGLTLGSQSAEYLELTPLGTKITKPHTPEEKTLGLQEAAQNVDVFKRVYDRFRDAKLPSDQYFKNMLEDDFNVPREHVEECISLIITNGRFANIIKDVAGAPRVVFEKAPIVPTEAAEEEEKEEGEVPEAPPPQPPAEKRIFIAHGKNKVPINQLKKILDEFEVPHVIAVDEPHGGRPISQKVADLMKSCSSAIFIFTADEEVVDAEGTKTYRPSQNVIYELGAAGYLYGKNIVIFKEEGVSFGSDFSDLGYINFEKDNLKAKATDLLKELIGFGLLKITPA